MSPDDKFGTPLAFVNFMALHGFEIRPATPAEKHAITVLHKKTGWSCEQLVIRYDRRAVDSFTDGAAEHWGNITLQNARRWLYTWTSSQGFAL